MIQRDYIQRMIEQISKVLGLLMGMDVPEDKIKVIHEAYAEWLKANPDFLRQLNPDNIIDTLTNSHGYTTEQLEFLAELMVEEGKAEVEANNTTIAINLLRKSLVLFDYVNKKQQLFCLERMEKIQKIEKELKKITGNTTRKK